jgi:hypothetical protein
MRQQHLGKQNGLTKKLATFKMAADYSSLLSKQQAS